MPAALSGSVLGVGDMLQIGTSQKFSLTVCTELKTAIKAITTVADRVEAEEDVLCIASLNFEAIVGEYIAVSLQAIWWK